MQKQRPHNKNVLIFVYFCSVIIKKLSLKLISTISATFNKSYLDVHYATVTVVYTLWYLQFIFKILQLNVVVSSNISLIIIIRN